MNKFLLWALCWVPRLLTIIFILFVSLFALDVFYEGYGIVNTLLALFMHLIPSLLLLVALLFSWRRGWGGFLFILIGVFFLYQFWKNSLIILLILSGVPVLIGCLFMGGWWYQTKPHTSL